MSKISKEAPLQAIDEPIICSAYKEPAEHWLRDAETGEVSRVKFRREAGYWYKTEEEQTGPAQGGMFVEQREALPLVNKLREDVRWWRDQHYPSASHITKELLQYWTHEGRERRLFFCQREAVETIIYLNEIRIPNNPKSVGGRKCALSDGDLRKLLAGETPSFKNPASDYHHTLLDKPSSETSLGLTRFGCKMATGSGKTLVMAMLIAWAFCNRDSAHGKNKRMFPSTVLVCCPNLTVKRRLSVLKPDEADNYYEAFDLVPPLLLPAMHRGKVVVTNWHAFAPESPHMESGVVNKVVDKGPETSETFAHRILGDAAERMPIMVLNDEGHHCWRAKHHAEPSDLEKEEKTALAEEEQKATVWIEGLDKLNSNVSTSGAKGISFCVDMSATPFHIKGSGYPEGWPFPWLVSDFGLVDAIESGIVKIPRVPVRDSTNHADSKYFHLWENIKQSLKPGEAVRGRKKFPTAKAAYKYSHGALTKIAGQWVERFQYIEQQNRKQTEKLPPPVLIIVCDNTTIAREIHQKISREGLQESKGAEGEAEWQVPVFPDYFANKQNRRYTIRIDSDILGGEAAAAEELRQIVATVGRKGEPGEHIRCVVSVSMLTEGWDANNVTQILGIRAFRSQLLCEQVVGRGLRRMDYVPDPETGLLTEEYVDVYGIPFSVIPYKGRPVDAKTPIDKPKTLVCALPDRAEMEMRFPIVDGYLFNLEKNLVSCDVDQMESMDIDPGLEPTFIIAEALGGGGASTQGGHFSATRQTREEFYKSTHINEIVFRLSHTIVETIIKFSKEGGDGRNRTWGMLSRDLLFKQVHGFVDKYVSRKINFNGVNPCELAVETYFEEARKRLLQAISPNKDEGETPLLPKFNSQNRVDSTRHANFKTALECFATKNSHISHVVLHSDWEGAAAQVIEEAVEMGYARHYARIYEDRKVGLAIPCGVIGEDYDRYFPDFLVRMASPAGDDWTLVLEIKGQPSRETEIKNDAAKRWVAAVNNWGEMGQWAFHVCYEPPAKKLLAELQELHARGPHPEAKEAE